MSVKACNSATHNCPRCPFKSRTVGYSGPIDAEIVIVGESPGSTEVRHGKPFVGPSGDLLDYLLKKANIDRSNILITNAFSCIPPRSKDFFGNKTKDSKVNDAAKACSGRLSKEIKAHPRKIILALGSAALRTLTNKWNASITSLRGQMIVDKDLASVGIMPTFHPAHVLRNPGLLPQVTSDFIRAMEYFNDKKSPDPKVTYKVINTIEACDEYVSTLQNVDDLQMALDIESTGLNRFNDSVRILGAIGMHEINPHGTSEVKIIQGVNNGAVIRRFFNTLPNGVKMLWHNGKFDTSMLRAKGISRHKVYVSNDTMLISYLLDEVSGRHGLDACTVDHLGLPAYKDETKDWMKANRKTFADIPNDLLYNRNAKDVVYTGMIFNKLYPRMSKDTGLLRVYNDLMIPGSNALATMELNGIPLSQDIIARNKVVLTLDVNESISKLKFMHGDPAFNPNSSVQVIDYLRKHVSDRLASSSSDALKRYTHVEFVKELLKFRGISKKLSTYVNPYIAYGDRVHTTYKMHGTVTGRLSSTGPNVQNTIKDELIREQYEAAFGRALLEVDYSQAELRSLAVLSGDPVMLEVFNSGLDLHASQAEFVYGERYTSQPKKLSDGATNPVRDKMRTAIKRVNFGIVYGITAMNLSENHGMTYTEAEHLIAQFAKRFKRAWEFIHECRTSPSKGITLVTPIGRRRRYRLVTDRNRHGIENEASNFPHQSMCSDFTLRAASIINEMEATMGVFPGMAKMINIIHDALIFEIDDDYIAAKKMYALVKPIMESVPINYGVVGIKFVVDAKIGTNWSKMFDFE